MSKIVVDVLPTSGKECPFGELLEMTSKYKCKFQTGMYSRCNLDCGKDCPYLTTAEIIKRDRREAEFINKMIEMAKMTRGHMPVKEEHE